MKFRTLALTALVCLSLGSIAGANPSKSTSAAGKPTIAVAEFKNTSSAAWWNSTIGWELSGLLSNELAATGRFTVLERDKIELVMQEQNLAASSRAKAGRAAQMGKIVTAQYLVMGTVTAYEEDTKSGAGGMSFGGISLKNKSREAYVAVDIRVVDTSTGQIAFARTIEGSSKSGGGGASISKFGFSGDASSETKSPAGRAVRGAVVRISDYLDCVMVVRDECLAKFQGEEERRRKKTGDAISID